MVEMVTQPCNTQGECYSICEYVKILNECFCSPLLGTSPR